MCWEQAENNKLPGLGQNDVSLNCLMYIDPLTKAAQCKKPGVRVWKASTLTISLMSESKCQTSGPLSSLGSL